ncbi:hypothetical protein AB0N05_22065 [Nocardia sp. NPDC051030]|uniref:DUF7373 family lipoprotein n=1 Tax=Nocardia sp. NPDC051030 TaxID=3155162 RepID=UPI003437C2F3
MGVRRRALAVILLAMTVGVVSSCDSGSDATQADPVIDVSKLDVGSYRAEPKDFAPKNTQFVARVFEAERMGRVLPLPSEVDPTLKVNRDDWTHVFLAPDEAHTSPMYAWLRKDGFAEDAKGFVAGFAATGQTGEDVRVSDTESTSVLLFESDQAATAASDALARRGWNLTAYEDGTQVEPARSVMHPDAVTSWVPSQQMLASWYATGKFVIVAIAESEENRKLKVSDQSRLLALTDRAITVTSDRLKSFQPAPPDQLTSVPMDPDGMLRMSLERPDGDSYQNMPGVYDLAGYLHFTRDPAKARSTYENFGIDRVSSYGSELFRTRDAAAAKDFLATELVDKFKRHAESPAGLPNARCNQYHGPEGKLATPFYCYVAFGRYVAMTYGSQLADAQQRISAQYAILARSA